MSKKAFTLIELLVVVAVLALLASIVFSNLGGAREGARISNALSFQSQTHSLLGSDLVGWWNFNGNLNDISGYENNGTWQGDGTPTYVDGVSATNSVALEFNGISSNEVRMDEEVVLPGIFTLSLWWVSYNNDGVRMAIGDAVTGGSRKFGVLGGNIFLRVVSSSNNSITAPTESEWNHIIVTRGTDNKVDLFINGEGPMRIFGDSAQVGNYIVREIGRHSPDNQRWYGKIDDVRIYSRALTSQEIKTLYAQTKNKYLAENE